jgi:hypothetical protein
MDRWKTSHAILVVENTTKSDELTDVVKRFCGKVFQMDKLPRMKHIKENSIVYVVSPCVQVCLEHEPLSKHPLYMIVDSKMEEDEMKRYENNQRVHKVDIFEVPILIHNAGVFWRKCFPSSIDYFAKINEEHKPQELTLHANPQKAYRTGFYATNVTQQEDGSLEFRLLRCSSNFSGPTDNLRETDKFIFDVANQRVGHVFPKNAKLNHVLAQIYHNSNNMKASIASHSDKTKDMNKDSLNEHSGFNEGGGLIAFASFYEQPLSSMLKQNPDDPLDIVYKLTKPTKTATALTQLQFKRKQDADPTLVENFNVLLYKNSMFVIDLETNRNYTHEIVPSILPSEIVPVRCGYVLRCSDVKSIHKQGKTHYEFTKNKFKLLKPLTAQKARDLKALYAQENQSSKLVNYPDIDFSMNAGDYTQPLL